MDAHPMIDKLLWVVKATNDANWPYVVFTAEEASRLADEVKTLLAAPAPQPETPQPTQGVQVMTDNRVFFPARLNCKHATLLSSVVGKMQAGVPYTPTTEELAELGNLAGAINMWANDPASPCIADVQTEPEIQQGDYSRKTFTPNPPQQIVVFPFKMPHGPFPGPNGGLMYMSVAEFGGSPWMRRLSISTQKGDMQGLQISDGKQATVYLTAGVDYPEGTPLYANLQITEAGAQPGTTGSGFSIVWPQQ